MNVHPPALFLPSELLESILLEKLANRFYAEPVIQLDLFKHEDDQESWDREYDRYLTEMANYFLYG